MLKLIQRHAPIVIYIDPEYSLTWDFLGDAEGEEEYPWYELPPIVKYNTKTKILQLC